MIRNKPAPGLVIAAPASGAGKTTVTLGLLRACRDRGVRVGSAKVGPDYIDPHFHAAASGRPCLTLDGWTMRPETLHALAGSAAADVDFLIVEGVTGLFDGAPRCGSTTDGSTAALAVTMGWPAILVIDAASQAQSVAALAAGFRAHCKSLNVAGVILNRVAGARHERLLRGALEAAGIAVFGAVPRRPALALPSRHLGLVQAREHPDLERLIAEAAGIVGTACDLATIQAVGRRACGGGIGPATGLPPLGQRIAIAHDEAFSFLYGHILDAWRRVGAEVLMFSPLADQAPPTGVDAVFLPGGYPELNAGRLAANQSFLAGLRRAAAEGCVIYGECGGYMVLGERLVDHDGATHCMAGLLGLESSFAGPALTLGYRRARSLVATPFGPCGAVLMGHEFHHAVAVHEGGGDRLFETTDSEGAAVSGAGRRRGAVFGSFLHLLDHGAAPPRGRPAIE